MPQPGVHKRPAQLLRVLVAARQREDLAVVADRAKQAAFAAMQAQPDRVVVCRAQPRAQHLHTAQPAYDLNLTVCGQFLVQCLGGAEKSRIAGNQNADAFRRGRQCGLRQLAGLAGLNFA